MRKSQWKPVQEDPQEKNEQRWKSYERPERTVGELRKTFELQKTIRPQRKNDDHGKVFEVQHHTGTGCKSYVLHLGVDQNRNIPNQEPQERNVSFSEKTPVKSVKGEQDIDKLQIKIDDLQKKIGDLLKIVALSDHLPRLQYNLQKQIGDLLKNLEKSPKKDDDFQKKFEEISTTIGDLLRKLDKGEQDRDVLWEKIDKIKQEKDKIAQEKDKIAQEKKILQHDLDKKEQEKKQLKKEIEKKKAQFKSVWREIPLYADWRKEEFQTVNLTLDAATAHSALFLSEEGRRVTWKESSQELPSCSQRFVSLPCVLAQLHVSSGRYFWEVEVQNAHSWDLGVCRDNVTREGRVTVSPQNGFWAIRLYDGEYWGLTSPETYLTLKEKPCRVGIFLDYEAGDVSFYNMADGSHIFTFSKQIFCGFLRPFFRLQSSDSGSLTIVQVK
ncbi:uncharacterized protein ACBT57_013571 isoform 1-T1 [Dama dama]